MIGERRRRARAIVLAPAALAVACLCFAAIASLQADESTDEVELSSVKTEAAEVLNFFKHVQNAPKKPKLAAAKTAYAPEASAVHDVTLDAHKIMQKDLGVLQASMNKDHGDMEKARGALEDLKKKQSADRKKLKGIHDRLSAEKFLLSMSKTSPAKAGKLTAKAHQMLQSSVKRLVAKARLVQTKGLKAAVPRPKTHLKTDTHMKLEEKYSGKEKRVSTALEKAHAKLALIKTIKEEIQKSKAKVISLKHEESKARLSAMGDFKKARDNLAKKSNSQPPAKFATERQARAAMLKGVIKQGERSGKYTQMAVAQLGKSRQDTQELIAARKKVAALSMKLSAAQNGARNARLSSRLLSLELAKLKAAKKQQESLESVSAQAATKGVTVLAAAKTVELSGKNTPSELNEAGRSLQLARLEKELEVKDSNVISHNSADSVAKDALEDEQEAKTVELSLKKGAEKEKMLQHQIKVLKAHATQESLAVDALH